jgi:hypothetical protein
MLEPHKGTWSQRQKVKLGDAGEQFVAEYLHKKGYICSAPIYDDMIHPYDFTVLKPSGIAFLADVKTKPGRKYYPDTGFNLDNYEIYKKVCEEHNHKMFIFFVDKERAEVYGNWLTELAKPFKKDGCEYPVIEQDRYGRYLIYFHISSLVHVTDIDKETLKKL